MRHVQGWGALAISLALLVALGVFGFLLVADTRAAAEASVREAAVSRQQTLAGLNAQYMQLAAKEAFDFAASHDFALTPDSDADRAILAGLLGRRGGLFDHGVVLTDLQGVPLTQVADAPGVPPADDPGYGPLRIALLRGQPGVSSVLSVGDVPLVAVAVPVLRGDEPAAVLTAFFRADRSHLQAYSEQLGAQGDAATMVVDRTGTIVAAHDADLVGRPAPRSPALDTAGPLQGMVEVVRDGQERVVAFATDETTGWVLLEERDADIFYAAVRSQSSTAQLSLLGALVLGGAMAIGFNHRTNRVRRRAEHLSQALVEDAHDVITITDPDGTITYASPAMRRVLGRAPDDVVGLPARGLVHPADLETVREATHRASETGDPQRIRARVLHDDGRPIPCEVVISHQRHHHTVRGTVVSMRDISELQALHDQLSHQALHDPLTELPNRTHLEHSLTGALASCPAGAHVAVLFVDLDGFKPVNDTHGHDLGDALLMEVAGRLRQAVREEDTVARLGGDEFVVVLPHVRDDGTPRTIAKRILELLDDPALIRGETVRIGASIGVALGDHTDEPGALLREADAAMYRAKENGRQRYELAPTVA